MNIRISYAAYPLLAVLLLFCFWLLTPDSGFRLPFYYTPDGAILPIDKGLNLSSAQVLRIRDLNALQSPVIFNKPGYINVVTDIGSYHLILKANQAWHLLIDFKIVILFALVNLLAAYWLFSVARDYLLGILCVIQTFFAFASYAVVVRQSTSLQLIWMCSSIFMPQALMNVGFRTTGKDIPAFVLVSEVILGLFLLLVSVVGFDNIHTVQNLGFFNYSLFAIALFVTLGMQFVNVLQKTEDRVEKYKNRVLLIGSLVGILLPATLFGLSYLIAWRSLSIDLIVLPGILFPLTLIYSTYRLHFVKFQLVLTRSLMAGILTVTLIGIYGTVLLVHSLLLPEGEGQYSWIVNVVFILILVFLLDPVRRYLSAFLEKRIYRFDQRLAESLRVLTAYIARHSRIQPTVNSFLHEIQKTLDLEKVSFLVTSDSFAGLHLRQGHLQRLPKQSLIWRYLQPGQMRVTAYLAYAAGHRGELFQYMYKNDYLLALGVISEEGGNLLRRTQSWLSWRKYRRPKTTSANNLDPLQAALMVGYKNNRSKLRLNEIRYLQEAAKLAELLIYNYALLIREMEKRQRIRELNLAGILQRSLPGPLNNEAEHFKLAFFNKPAVSVSGDYLDILELENGCYAFLLGDVSGHGLGTGYIVSAVRSIIRSHLLEGMGLAETINSVNTFLVDRYRGGEFITLFAGILEVESGRLEYINAAHPAALVLRTNGELQELLSTQRLVGVLPTVYFSEEVYLHNNDRLVFYSDGITETFNNQDEGFGEQRLEQLILQNQGLSEQEIVNLIESSLVQFRQDSPQSDDLTLVMLRFTPHPGVLQGLLGMLGLGRGGPD